MNNSALDATPNNLQHFMVMVVHEMQQHEDAWPFLHPVSLQDVPDYLDIIKVPLSVSEPKRSCDSKMMYAFQFPNLHGAVVTPTKLLGCFFAGSRVESNLQCSCLSASAVHSSHILLHIDIPCTFQQQHCSASVCSAHDPFTVQAKETAVQTGSRPTPLTGHCKLPFQCAMHWQSQRHMHWHGCTFAQWLSRCLRAGVGVDHCKLFAHLLACTSGMFS